MRDFCVTLSRTYVHLWLFGCSERQRKQLLFKGLPCLGGHGVLGVECSNHSVPTIFFNDLAQPNPLGFFMSKKRPLLGPLPAGNLCLFLLAAIAGLEV